MTVSWHCTAAYVPFKSSIPANLTQCTDIRSATAARHIQHDTLRRLRDPQRPHDNPRIETLVPHTRRHGLDIRLPRRRSRQPRRHPERAHAKRRSAPPRTTAELQARDRRCPAHGAGGRRGQLVERRLAELVESGPHDCWTIGDI